MYQKDNIEEHFVSNNHFIEETDGLLETFSSSQTKDYTITKIVNEEIRGYGIYDLHNNLKNVVATEFSKLKNEVTINVTEEVKAKKKDVKGSYYVVLYDKKGKIIHGSTHRINISGNEIIQVRYVTQETLDSETYPNYEKLKAAVSTTEKTYPDLKGKLYFRSIQKGDNIFKLTQKNLGENTTSFQRLYTRLVEINKGIEIGKVGNGVILIKNWTDPNIGKLTEKKPEKDSLSLEQKQLIATIYGEKYNLKDTGTKEQQKYIWYSMLLRVKDPNKSPSLYENVSGGEYDAFEGNTAYKNAMKMLNEGKTDSELDNIIEMLRNNWSLKDIPNDAGKQYVHWPAVKKYFKGDMDSFTDKEEKAAVWDFLESKGWNATGLSKESPWKKRIRANAQKLPGTMYVFN